MPMPKRKPNYNPTSTMQELLTAVCDYYGDPVDDRQSEDPDHISLHDVADEFDITVMKARKLLITGGLYASMEEQKKYYHVMRDVACFVRDNYPFLVLKAGLSSTGF